MKASTLIRMTHSRPFGVAVSVIAFIGVLTYFLGGHIDHVTGDKGPALPSANNWVTLPAPDFVAGIGGSAVTVLIMLLLNKVYNVMRSMTSLFIALFAAMQLATPSLFGQFYTGTLLAVAVPLCMMLLFSCFRTPSATRNVFLIFLILSGLTTTQYCFMFYIPVFLAGLGQMQIFGARSLTAAILGIITPWWILAGFGIIDLSDMVWPQFGNIASLIGRDDTVLLLVTLGITAFVMLLCYVLNLLKTMAYNARSRAVNGTFTLTALVTVAAAAIDYRNIISYIPLLNYSAAMEITHYFSTHRGEKSFIPVLVLIAVYIAIFVCQTVI